MGALPVDLVDINSRCGHAIVWHVIPVSSSYSSQDEDIEGSEANGIGCACVLSSLQRSPRLVSHTIAAGRRGDLRGVFR